MVTGPTVTDPNTGLAAVILEPVVAIAVPPPCAVGGEDTITVVNTVTVMVSATVVTVTLTVCTFVIVACWVEVGVIVTVPLAICTVLYEVMVW